jgi:AcrR family transcriptional regulator
MSTIRHASTERRRPGRPPWSDLKERLADASWKIVFAGRALTVRGVAKEVGRSEQAVYLHYSGGLKELNGAVAQRGFERLAGRLAAVAAEARAVRPRLAAVTRAYIEFAVQRPELYRLMLAGGFEREFWKGVLDARVATMEVIEGVVREAQEAGLVREGAVQHLAETLWALVHARATLILGDEEKPASAPVREWADRTVKTFLVAVGTRAHAAHSAR